MLECAVLFFVGPILYYITNPGPGWMFPALWAWALVCLFILLCDRGFDRHQLWNLRGLKREIRPMLLRFAVLGGLIVVAVVLLAPDRLLSLPRHNPRLWAMIMVGYPLASVYPQEVIFRAFFFRRYAPLFGERGAMLAASAVAFGFVHIIFDNPIAVAMTLVGGVLFSLTYARSRSVLAASVEHALYGCLIFTIGIGAYFYTGAN